MAADTQNPQRCTWANSHPLLMAYHDQEWGVPEHDSRALWEKLILDGFQAGLSWLTVLKKRDAFRHEFKGFHPEVVARFSDTDVDRMLQNPDIIRSRAKIQAAVRNAQAYLDMQTAGEDFSTFVWGFVGKRPIVGDGTILAKTPLSEEISRALKSKGFLFVGPVIVYAWMQACGLVNDHAPDCFLRNRQPGRLRRSR